MRIEAKKVTAFFILFLFGAVLAELKAQETVPASGSDASGTGGTVNYSVGQMEYTVYSSVAGSVSQGIQLPYEILVVTSVAEAQEISLTCAAYPNPVSGLLHLWVGDNPSEHISYSLYTAEGKLLETKKIEGSEASIGLAQFPDAVYFLNVYNQGVKIKTFRIVHN
jgi:hypothetical protein